jgi:hypothetical protein
MTGWRTRFEPGALVVEAYPFPRGDRPQRLASEALSEVCVGWWPPAVRTREGEYLFVPASQVRELADFADRESIPFVRRTDVWSFILEEFLDTSFPPEQQERTLRLLESHGVSRDETQAMRKRVEKRMLALTAATWEWVHYGLYDVLEVMRPLTFLGRGGYSEFYEEAMRLADRGGTKPATREDFLRCFPEPKR